MRTKTHRDPSQQSITKAIFLFRFCHIRKYGKEGETILSLILICSSHPYLFAYHSLPFVTLVFSSRSYHFLRTLSLFFALFLLIIYNHCFPYIAQSFSLVAIILVPITFRRTHRYSSHIPHSPNFSSRSIISSHPLCSYLRSSHLSFALLVLSPIYPFLTILVFFAAFPRNEVAEIVLLLQILSAILPPSCPPPSLYLFHPLPCIIPRPHRAIIFPSFIFELEKVFTFLFFYLCSLFPFPSRPFSFIFLRPCQTKYIYPFVFLSYLSPFLRAGSRV